VWFWLWAGLITVGLGTILLGLRWLWRQAVQLFDVLGAATEALGRLESGASSFASAAIPPPALLSSAAELQARRQSRWERIAQRRTARRLRHQAVYDSWAVLAGYRDV
jgi:hypothetical protein